MKLVSSDLTHLKLKETALLFHLFCYLRSTDLSPDHSVLSGVLFFLLLYFRTAPNTQMNLKIQTHKYKHMHRKHSCSRAFFSICSSGILYPTLRMQHFLCWEGFQREPHAFGLGHYTLSAPAADHEAEWPFLEPLLSESEALHGDVIRRWLNPRSHFQYKTFLVSETRKGKGKKGLR